MTSKQYEQAEAMKRIERRAKPEQVRCIGTAEDLIAAGIIGPHMIAAPGDRALTFRYGRRWEGPYEVGGVCSVVHVDGKLAVYLWTKLGDETPTLESARPSWNLGQGENVLRPPQFAMRQRPDTDAGATPQKCAEIIPFPTSKALGRVLYGGKPSIRR